MCSSSSPLACPCCELDPSLLLGTTLLGSPCRGVVRKALGHASGDARGELKAKWRRAAPWSGQRGQVVCEPVRVAAKGFWPRALQVSVSAQRMPLGCKAAFLRPL